MYLSILLLLCCAVAIYAACEFFVNGIEWLGRKLEISETATGTVLAAFGTALPESAVTFVAVAVGASAAQKEIGVGAALGGPLVLATLSYALVGLVLLFNVKRLQRKGSRLLMDQRRLSRDQVWFLSIFILKIGLGLVLFTGKSWFGLFFLGAYGLYIWKEIRMAGAKPTDLLKPLILRPRAKNPSFGWITLQTGGALIVIGIASRMFVLQLEGMGPWLGMSAQLVSLLLSPIATELPETVNAVIWVRQGKERLALANISGAMMIQATVPSALGIIFTPWLFDVPLIIAGLITTVAVLVLFVLFHRGKVSGAGLLPLGTLYLLFIALVAHYA